MTNEMKSKLKQFFDHVTGKEKQQHSPFHHEKPIVQKDVDASSNSETTPTRGN